MVFEDEIGYLMNSRALAGLADGARLHEMGSYQAGWSLLLTPLNWVFSDAGALYRAALVLTAVVSALVVVPLSWLGRRVLGLSSGTAVAAATVAALYPGRVLMSGYVYAEAALALCVAVTVVAAFWYWERRTIAAAATLGGLSAFLYALHGRAIGIAAVAAVFLTWDAVRRKDWRPLAGVLSAVAVVVGAELLNRWLKTELYMPRRSRLSGSLSNLPDTPPRALIATILGQSWYLVTASIGLAALGALELGRRTLTELRRRTLGPWCFVVTAFATVAAVTVPAMARAAGRGTRLDYVIYGRYLDALMPVILLLGGAALLRATHVWERLTPVVAIPLLGLGTRLVSLPGFYEGAPIAALSVAGIAAWIDPARQEIPFLWASLGAALIAGAVALIPLRRAVWRVAAVGVAFVALSVTGEVRTMGVLDTPWQSLVQLQHQILDLDLDTSRISYDEAGQTLHGRNGYQYWLPDTQFVFFDSADGDRPRTELVIARWDWPLADDLGARMVASEERLDEALWVLPGPAQDRLRAQGRLVPEP
jgi:hypothetical protein